MNYINIRNVPHYYQWIPEQPNGNKPVMVFIHGWGGSARYWESTAIALSDQFDCLLYDLRGFGRSNKSPNNSLGYELESYADDLAILLETLHLEKVYINAHSMGASIATFFLNRYPEKVEKAILTCSGIFTYNEQEFKAFYQFGGYVVQFRPYWLTQIPFMDTIFMARFLHRTLPSKISTAFLEDFILADYDAALGTIFTAVSKKATEIMPLEFAQIKIPTLLISGYYDKIIPAKMGKQASELNDLLEFKIIPNTAHFPMLEDQATYLQEILGFINI